MPCGTTGESPTLTRAEHLRVVEITVEEAKGKVPVLGGAGGYNTAEVIELAKELRHLGVDGILSVTPYYNKPTQEGLYQHYKAIASAVPLPIDRLQRAGPHRRERRAGDPEAPGRDRQYRRREGSLGQYRPDGADGASTSREHSTSCAATIPSRIPLIALGGRGVISVVSNEIPAEMTQLTQLALAGDFAGARALQRHWLPLMEVNFVESNPIPVKAAMAMMGLLEPVWRLPMTPPSEANRAKIEAVLKSSGLSRRCWTSSGARMRTEIEKLFDEKPATYTEEHFALFQRFKQALNRGRDPLGRAGRVRAQRLARERLGEERHPARLPHGRGGRSCRSIPCGCRCSIRPPGR